MQALLRLSKRAKLLPQSFSLSGVQRGEVIVQSPNVDIFRGLHGGRNVCLKMYRVRRQSQSNSTQDFVEVGIISPRSSRYTISFILFAQLLIREMIIWHNHRHPNLLPFEGVFRPNNNFGEIYLVSPFLENGTVAQYLENHPDVERRLLVRGLFFSL
jgi:serine/threonine protein kinase